MITKIKNYLKLRRMKKDATALLLINGAEAITSLKNIVSEIESIISKHGDVFNSISKEDVSTIVDFANKITTNPQLSHEMFEKIHDDAQKLREAENGK